MPNLVGNGSNKQGAIGCRNAMDGIDSRKIIGELVLGNSNSCAIDISLTRGDSKVISWDAIESCISFSSRGSKTDSIMGCRNIEQTMITTMILPDPNVKYKGRGVWRPFSNGLGKIMCRFLGSNNLLRRKRRRNVKGIDIALVIPATNKKTRCNNRAQESEFHLIILSAKRRKASASEALPSNFCRTIVLTVDAAIAERLLVPIDIRLERTRMSLQSSEQDVDSHLLRPSGIVIFLGLVFIALLSWEEARPLQSLPRYRKR